ncbi:hypothetical protein K2X89_17280, partial [Myxococcota bacterium]|nr:hypothetical protein [Myxococcota bacterium]
MFQSRPRRNRYRRRPSRLTALGKGVVATTVAGMLALGWASQASRHPDRSVDEAAMRPVSAPPRWPAAPSLGALVAPSPAAPAPGATAAPERDAIPFDADEPRPAPAVPSASQDVSAVAIRPVAPPTSRARFEQARRHGRSSAAASLDAEA